MAWCKRVGTAVLSGSRAASAASMRARQDSSWAANASRRAGSACGASRISAALFTLRQPRSTPAVGRTRPPHLGNRNRDRKVLQRIAVQDRQLGSHRARHPRTPQGGLQRLDRVSERVLHRRAFEAAVGHAVVALGVAPDAVLIPARILQQGSVAGRVAFIGEQVAGPLPTEDVIGRVAPRRALIGLVAREKIQEQPGMIEGPAAGAAAAAFEDLAEQPLARAAAQEHILPRSILIAVAWRDRDY